MTTAQFIEKSLRGETRKTECSSVFSYGDTIYSYGYHYPLVTIINNHAFVNTRGYSATTAKHIYWAIQAASNIVGYANTYSIPLSNGNSLTKWEIMQSAEREMKRLEALMLTKKRKNTAVYEDLQRQYDNMAEIISNINGL